MFGFQGMFQCLDSKACSNVWIPRHVPMFGFQGMFQCLDSKACSNVWIPRHVPMFGFQGMFGFCACFHLPFVAFCCSSLLFLVFEIESILSRKPKQANAFCGSLWLFVARFLFLWMFPFEHRIARCGFVGTKKPSNKMQKSPNGNQA